MQHKKTARFLLCLTTVLSVASCRSGDGTSEEQMRQIQDRMEASLPQRQKRALEQDVAPQTVRTVQRQLRAVQEYQGEPDGELDDVTVNAIQAFQRRIGLEDNGLLTDETRRHLRQAARSPEAPTTTEGGRSSGPPS